ncbi:trypsin-like serine peptidase [Bacillus atrophaeus]|uniref:trypsin-like serine peptidase n=1 Tax=Bacillus atrophaeus TaxID=1452 RepID=UPI00255C048A|nr:serine protease [Bacillus atrophaeus]MDL5144160.1 serine protease [Bacillus atrophaeus]
MKKAIIRRLNPEEWKGNYQSLDTFRSQENLNQEVILSSTNEKIIGINNLMSIAWLTRGLELAKTVGRVNVPGSGYGTGFLISPDLLITNNHVISSVEEASRSFVEFNYELDWNGNLKPSRRFEVDSTVFRTNPELDYTIVKVKGNPGHEFGYVDLKDTATPNINENVVIIQHPKARTKEIALTDNIVKDIVDNKFLHYTTDTENGSSGSAVFDTNWKLIALHHKGGQLPNSSGGTHFINEGILISRILQDAREFLGLHDELLELAFGQMKATLVIAINEITKSEEIGSWSKKLDISYPQLTPILNNWVHTHNNKNELEPLTVAGVGVAIGAAIRHWGKKNESATTKSFDSIIPKELETLVSSYRDSQLMPSEIYEKVSEKILNNLEMLLPILNINAREDFGLATVFLTGVVVGASAYDGKKLF